MKDFLTTFAIVIVSLFVFVFFGGFVLFDFSGHFWLAVASCAFVLSLFLHGFYRQSQKIEELEKRITSLESEKNGAE